MGGRSRRGNGRRSWKPDKTFHIFNKSRRTEKKNQIAKSDANADDGDDVQSLNWEEDIVAFALGEIGLRYEEFYDMPFCEFLIKSFAYERMQKERLRHTRLIAYSAQIGSHLDPKSLPKTLEKFMPIDGEETKMIDMSIVDDFKKMREDFEKQHGKFNLVELLNKNSEEGKI